MSVKIHVSSPDTFSERHYDLQLTVEQLKRKLESVTGISPASQRLELCRSQDDLHVIGTLEDDSKAIGFYGVQDGMLIKVTDTNPASIAGQFVDTSLVEKFEITPEEYAQKRGTVLEYKKQHKMGRFAPGLDKAPATSPPVPSQSLIVGGRCEVTLETGEGLNRRGTIRFVGPTKFGKGGDWVGVEYDEPVGKNDGSVQGERYFECRPNYGAFVRADKVRGGDFPVEDYELEEM
ncbi:hypothetical protein FRB94_008886 [Tulasnella sp. JGI-2019a]|nr:hypothetical protein FRB94_008886 [Tulasnella sp. JGI-2019a]KAG9000770.1 hypothetical protein FRB93_012596 [Tulasnella sp. JGI-2019a]KAG9030309.1 hypothetical protein FRB95_004141 [Tulasnella sp. JGI-2019a]